MKRNMNSRGWQIGMVLAVLLSVGILATVPPLIRALYLREKIAWVAVGIATALAISLITVPSDGYKDVMGYGYLFYGMLVAGYLYRPYPGVQTVPEPQKEV